MYVNNYNLINLKEKCKAIYTLVDIPRTKSKESWNSTLVLSVSRSLRKLSTRRVPTSWHLPGPKNVSSFTGSSMTQPSQVHQRGTCRIATSGFKSTSCAASSMVCSPQLQPLPSSLWSEDSHLWEDLLFQCCQWPTFWTGATSGATRTGGDVQRKSSSPTRSTPALVARWPWSESNWLLYR